MEAAAVVGAALVLVLLSAEADCFRAGIGGATLVGAAIAVNV